MPTLLPIVPSDKPSNTYDLLTSVTHIEQPIAIDWALKELRHPKNISASLLRRLLPDKQFFARYIWRKVPVDRLIFALPSHEGQPVDLARQVYHLLLARLVAHRVSRVQSRIIVFSWLVSLGLGTGIFAPSAQDEFYQQRTPYGDELNYNLYDRHVEEARSFGIILGTVGGILGIGIGAAILTRRAYDPKIATEAEAIINRTFFRVLPEGTPADLRDTFRRPLGNSRLPMP